MITSISDKITAIRSLVPEAEVSIFNGGVTWHKPTEAPVTDKEIQVEMDRLQAEYDAQAYARNRQTEYPSNGDQWDMIYKDNKNSTTTHADAVEAVKIKWPKDNSGPK